MDLGGVSMPDVPNTLWIVDANILICLDRVNRLHLLEGIHDVLGCEVRVPFKVAEEVASTIPLERLMLLNVRIEETTSAIARDLLEEKRKQESHEATWYSRGLSEADCEVVLQAKHKGGCVWSNDRLVREAASNLNLRTYWLMEPLYDLVENGLVCVDDIRSMAAELSQRNDVWGFPKDFAKLVEDELRRRDLI